MTKLLQAAVLKGHEKQVWDAVWKKNSNFILSCSGDKSLRMWAPIKQTIPRKLTIEEIEVITKANTELKVNQEEKQVLLNPYSWMCLFSLEQAHQRSIRSVTFEPTTGEMFASASFDGSTGIWGKNSSNEYECFTSLEGHENEVKSVSWSSSGQLIATCGRDKSIWIWEAMGEYEFDCISVLMEHTQDVKAVRWHPVEDVLVSASYDDTIRIWRESEDDWYCSSILTGHASTVWSVEFDPTGSYIVSCSDDLTIKIWTKKAQEHQSSNEIRFNSSLDEEWDCICTVPSGIHTRSVYSVSWSHHYPHPKVLAIDDEAVAVHNGYIASTGGDNSICIFSVTSTLKSIGGSDSTVKRLDQIMLGEPLEDLGSYSTESMECKLISKVGDAHGYFDINSVQWNPNTGLESWLVTAGDDNNAKIWYLDE